MLNLILGVVLIAFGLWGMTTNWMMFLDTFKMIVFLGLIVFGIVAILAGIKQSKGKQKAEKNRAE